MALIGLVVDRIGLRLAHHRGVDHPGGIDQPDLADFALGQLDQLRVGGGPQPVAFEAEVFQAEAGEALGGHFRGPGQEVLHPPDLDRRVMDIDPVVRETGVGMALGHAGDQRHGDEVAVAQSVRPAVASGPRLDRVRQLGDRGGGDHMARAVGLGRPVRRAGSHGPKLGAGIPARAGERAAHQDRPALRPGPGRGRLPHHAGALPRIAEVLDQGLDPALFAQGGGRPLLQSERALHPVDDRRAEAQPLDPLRGPVGGDLIAGHAPHLLGVGAEEDREQLLAELVAHPLVEGAGLPDRGGLGDRVGGHAQGAGEHPEVLQRLERPQRVGVELPTVEDPRQARPLDEVVGQDLVPEVDDLPRLGEEAVAADIEQETLVVHRPADAADVGRVALDHGHALARLGQQIGGGQAGGARTYDQDVDRGLGAAHSAASPRPARVSRAVSGAKVKNRWPV